MTALLILALFAGGLFLACAWADRVRGPADSEPYQQPTHVHVLNDDQEPAA